MMKWHELINEERLERLDAERQDGRSPFQQDIDRIVFSEAFRRLAHKTQVHPLSENDHVHTRLTHSIEVASVGRSLGTIVGSRIAQTYKNSKFSADAFGYIVQAACLAHDIGNPPFGHSGEEAISEWFRRYFKKNAKVTLETRQKNDFVHFDGNAQGFRIITQLENNKWEGGLQLTYAVLATFCKYPHSAEYHPILNSTYVGCKKIGFYHSEEKYFENVANAVGLIYKNNYWCRHPLSFLVEAADDICYSIIDIEDGYALGYLELSTAEKLLTQITGDEIAMGASMSPREKVAKWRAIAIGKIIKAVAEAFIENQTALLDGTLENELICYTPYKIHIENAKEIAKHKIYWSDRKTKIEIAGAEILSGLLDIFVPVAEELERVNWRREKLNGRAQNLSRLILPDNFKGVKTYYGALLCISDFISGMTDRYALDLYRKLKGISI